MRRPVSTLRLLVVCLTLSFSAAHAGVVRETQRTSGAQFQSWMAGAIAQPSYAPSSPDNWLGGTGNWSNGADWSAGEPGGGSDVSIKTGNDNVTLDVNASINSLTLGGATGSSSLSASGHTLTIAGALTINQTGTLTLQAGGVTAGGTLMNAGTVTLTAGSNVQGANVVNSGSIGMNGGFVGATSTLTNSGSITSADMISGVSAHNVVNSGAIIAFAGSSSGDWNNQAGLTDVEHLDIGGNLMNGGTVEGITPGNTLNVTGRLTNSGTVDSSYGNATFGSVSNLSGGLIRSGADTVNGNVTNAGTILVDGVATGPFVSFVVSGSLTNSGFFQVAGSGDTSPTAGAASVTNSGTIEVDSMGRFGAGTTITNSGTIRTGVLGPNSGHNTVSANTLTNLAGGIVSLGATSDTGNFGYISNAGSISIANGATLNVGVGSHAASNASPGFLNSGIVAINSGGTLFSTRTYTQTAGQTTVDGTLHVSGNGIANFAGGSVYGNNGTIQANVLSNAAFNIGDMPMAVGALAIAGNYTQLANGSLTFDIASASQYDQLNVSGHASLNGLMTVDLLNGYIPQSGNTFDIVNFAGSSGTFSMVVGLPINSQEHFVLEYNPTNLTLDVVAGPDNVDPVSGQRHGSDQVYVTDADYNGSSLAMTSYDSPGSTVPEPGSASLLAIGLMGAAARLLRRS